MCPVAFSFYAKEVIKNMSEKLPFPIGTIFSISLLPLILRVLTLSVLHNVGTILLTLFSVLVGICSMLAYMGFNGRITTVGIDLGTTFSVVGLNRYGGLLVFYQL